MGTGHLHLVKRGTRYWWRRRIPAPLSRACGVSQVRRALRTADPATARRRARRASAAFDVWLAAVENDVMEGRVAPTKEDLKRILDELFEKVLADGELRRAMRPPGPPDWIVEGPGDPDDPEEMAEAERRAAAAEPSAQIPELRDKLFLNDCTPAMADLDAILAARGLSNLNRTSPQFRVFVREAMRVYIRARELDAEREEKAVYVEDASDGRFFPAPLRTEELPLPPLVPATTHVAGNSPPVITTAPHARSMPSLAGEFKAWQRAMAGNAWTDEHAVDSHTAWKLWRELMGGEFRIDEVTNRQAWDFRGELGKVPALHGRSVFKDLSARAAIERADAIERGAFDPSEISEKLRKGEKVARLSKKTQNKHVDFFIGLYNWEGISHYNLGNPFSGTLHKKREMRRDAVETRTALEDEFQVRLFSTPVWRGSVSAYYRAKPRPVEQGGVIVRDALFWLPLLAAFQGLRLTEALQLFVEDVVPAHGTHWICVRRGRGRRVKTDAGLREIPLHPELRHIGFVEYVEQQRAAGERRLFPRYAPHPEKLARSGSFSKAFGYYRRAVGCGELWKDFHAERHAVDTVLIRAGVRSRLVAEICGHEGGHLEARPLHMTNKLYFGGYQPKQLIDAINCIAYSGLDLSHLYAKPTKAGAE